MLFKLMLPIFLSLMNSKSFSERETARMCYTVYVCKYGTYKDLPTKGLSLTQEKIINRIEEDIWAFVSDGKGLPIIQKFQEFNYFPQYRSDELNKAVELGLSHDPHVRYNDSVSYFYIKTLLERGDRILFIKRRILIAREREW